MKLLTILALALALAATASAQQPALPQPDHTMDALLAARATMIQRYVLSEKTAVRVSVCGDTDLINGEEHSYLCVYVHRDKIDAFAADFTKFATAIAPEGYLGVNGIPVSVELILDPEPKRETPGERPIQPSTLPRTSKT